MTSSLAVMVLGALSRKMCRRCSGGSSRSPGVSQYITARLPPSSYTGGMELATSDSNLAMYGPVVGCNWNAFHRVAQWCRKCATCREIPAA